MRALIALMTLKRADQGFLAKQYRLNVFTPI
jgi:hypothetical protein